VAGWDAGLGDKGIAHLSSQGELVATTAGDAVACGLLGGGRRAVGALVEVEQDRAGGGSRGGLRLAEAGQAAASGDEADTGQLQDVAAGSGQVHGQDSEGQPPHANGGGSGRQAGIL